MKKRRLLLIPVAFAALLLLLFAMGGGFSLFRFAKLKTPSKTPARSETLHIDTTATEKSNATIDYDNAYKGSGVPDVLAEDVLARYLEYLQPADDEYDFRYATDFQDMNLVKIHKGRDRSSYERIIGYTDVTLEQIRQALDSNTNISPKYKDFIYQYACDLRTLYPDCNLAVLHHNLATLIVDEMTQAEIDKETLSTNSAACYLRYENRICVAEGLDLSRESDDYIIMVHELCHAARCLQKRTEDPTDYDIDIGFYDFYKMGTYAEEGIVTNISYELQGMGNKATFYPMLASYYRIICSCIDYSGEDFFNHGVNYLIDQMDAFMGDEDYAYQIIAKIDAQMALRYTPYQGVDFYDFQPVYEYLAAMYFKKHISPDTSREEAQKIFDAFYEDISFHFENMNRGYDITNETFRETFENYLKDISII